MRKLLNRAAAVKQISVLGSENAGQNGALVPETNLQNAPLSGAPTTSSIEKSASNEGVAQAVFVENAGAGNATSKEVLANQGNNPELTTNHTHTHLTQAANAHADRVPLVSTATGHTSSSPEAFQDFVKQQNSPTNDTKAGDSYLTGFRHIDGDVTLIQYKFFRTPSLWMQRRIADLQDSAVKAEAYFESTVPAWDDPLPTEEASARMWRLTFKAMAQRWECRLLEAYLAQHGGVQPTAGYKGHRVFLPMLDVDQVADLLRDVRWLMSVGAPGVWHGRHLVQLPEADWLTPLDHPSVRYRQSRESTPAIAQSQESPVTTGGGHADQ